jgi:integrase/recombinase XerD
MFQPMIDEMKLRNYSKRTITSYLHYNRKFLQLYRMNPQKVRGNDIRKYLLQLIAWRKSSATVNLAHNALNFYYCTIMKRRFTIPFQKKEKKILPVASKEEIQQLIKVTKNPKHKLIISLLYASGVRRSELVSIKLQDINFKRRLLHVRQGKRKRDRYTILSHQVIHEIKMYLEKRNYTSNYLFASRDGHITSATVEAVVKKAKKKAKITKNITPHSLRRSFATHHIIQGTQEKYLQKMMGHKDPKSLLPYIEVANNHLSQIRSPHDQLN